MDNYRATLKARLTPEQFQKTSSNYAGRKFLPFQVGFSPSDFGGMPPFPDDDRFQLAWDRLSLSGTLPHGTKLLGENLTESNWVKIARQVDSD